MLLALFSGLLPLAAHDRLLGGIARAGVGVGSTIHRVVALHTVARVQRVVATDPHQGVGAPAPFRVLLASEPLSVSAWFEPMTFSMPEKVSEPSPVAVPSAKEAPMAAREPPKLTVSVPSPPSR